jgi:uncharacterized protein YqgV (UPF0045/DUF77 family)
MLVEIQVLPSPVGTDTARYPHVDAAIARIQESGLTYEVGPLGTSIEGTPEQVWPLLRAVHEATLESGAGSVMSVIKVGQAAADRGPTMTDLTGKFRT